jgi:hypothetical protein
MEYFSYRHEIPLFLNIIKDIVKIFIRGRYGFDRVTKEYKSAGGLRKQQT